MMMMIMPAWSARPGLAEDDQDSVRLQTVDNCSALARVLPPEGQKEHVLPVVLDTTKDK